ncbi:hypothetical protein [Rhodovulum sp. PH10]|uniref:hypothetical protein n=1 Tax=Rhodovulum sp. PH10 TaxID=1187851 RepID=UPI00058EEBD9|nr:hypothetical protein [Rhodovulum sp. PH10]
MEATVNEVIAKEYDPVSGIEARRFRHTLLFPMALARGRSASEFDTPACLLVDRFADALCRLEYERWMLIDPVAHCDPLDMASMANLPDGAPAGRTAPAPDIVAEHYQEMIFFHRFVQRFLYEKAHNLRSEPTPPLKVFRRHGTRAVTITLQSVEPFKNAEAIEASDAWRAAMPDDKQGVSKKGRRRRRDVRLSVDAVNLHLFRAGIAMLAVTVSLPRTAEGGVQPCVLDRSETEPSGEMPEPRCATVADLLDLTECFRRLYIPYWVKSAVGKTPHDLALDIWADSVPSAVAWHHVEGPKELSVPSREEVLKAFNNGFDHGVPRLLPWWKELLPSPLVLRGTSRQPAEAGLPEWRFGADERMATTTFLAVPDPARLSAGTWARLCFCDKADDGGLPYGKGFLEDFDARHAYDRFRTWGTRYVMCGYNMACVTEDGDFTDLIELHMRRHYFQMVLVSQFQAAMLLAFSNWVSEAMEHYDVTAGTENESARERLRLDLHGIEREFQAFVHRYWFTGVSNQVQPSEIYSKLRKLLSLDTWFDEVLREIETSRGFLRDQEQERTARSAERLSLLAGVGLLVVVPAGLLGMNYSLGEKTWLVDILASEPVRRALPSAASCVVPERFTAALSVTGQLGWTMLLVGLSALVLWSFPHLPSNRAARDRKVAGGAASLWLRRLAGWVAIVSAGLVAAFLIAGPLCTAVRTPQ